MNKILKIKRYAPAAFIILSAVLIVIVGSVWIINAVNHPPVDDNLRPLVYGERCDDCTDYSYKFQCPENPGYWKLSSADSMDAGELAKYCDEIIKLNP